MTKEEVLAELDGFTPEEASRRIGRAKLAEWWTIVYGVAPSKNRTGMQLAYDMCQMLRATKRARALSRGLLPH